MKKSIWMMVVLTVAGIAQAGLVLNINTTDKTFTFTGSDAGTPSTGWIVWQKAESVDAGDEWWSRMDDISATCTSTLEYSGAEAPNLLLTKFGMKGSYTREVSIRFVYTENSYTELEGSGVYQSYASLDSLSLAHFESLIGGTIAADTSGFSDIQVQAVPEPATAGLLGISAGALWLFRRAKNHYRS